MSSSNNWAGNDRLRSAVSLWVCALALGVSELAADYKTSYRAGIEATDEGRWEDAETHMREAIREQPQEGGRRIKVYGNRWAPYLPHYYLGVALYENGDCSGAMDAWETSVRHGAIKGQEGQKLARMRAKCQAQSPAVPPPSPLPAVPAKKPPPPVPKVDPAEMARALEETAIRLGEAANAARDLTELEKETGTQVLMERSHGFSEGLANSMERIRAAGDGFELARIAEDIGAVEEAGHQAANAQKELDVLRQTLNRLRKELVAEAQVEEEARLQALVALDQLSADASQLSSLAVVDDGKVHAARKVLDELQRQTESVDEKTTAELLQLRERLNAAVESLRSALKRASLRPSQRPSPPPSPAVPTPLREAAQAFFSAEYVVVLEVLGKADLSLPKARATALLLSAAARHAILLEGGDQDTDLREAAAADAAACLKLDPRFAPATPFFSPAFTEFFHASR